MRRRVARFLRRVAYRLDPPVPRARVGWTGETTTAATGTAAGNITMTKGD